jgi:hypothetical protein
MQRDHGGSLDDLLADLRRDLRAELELEPIGGGVLHLRMTGNDGEMP